MRRFPLDVLLVNDDPHNYTPAGTLHRLLHCHPAVRSYGIASAKKALTYLRQGKVNTLFVSPGLRYSPETLQEMKQFISVAESEWPRVVVVVYAMAIPSLLREMPELESYYKLDAHALMEDGERRSTALDDVLSKCEEWHETRFDYDLAISFAGEDRKQAESIALALKEEGVRVFYDQFEQASLFGKDLYVHLYEVYAKRSRYCILLASEHYLEKMWTIHERRAAQERALQERGAEYILPVRIDETDIPGLASTIGFLSYEMGPQKIAETLLQKLWLTGSVEQKRYIGYSLYDYDVSPLHQKVRRANPQYSSLYIPPSLEYELIRDKEEADQAAIAAARSEAIKALRIALPEFAKKLESLPNACMDEVLPGMSAEDVSACEERLRLSLPESYKRFLRAARGFWLFNGCVQFSKKHPYLHEFPDYESLPESGKKEVELNGGVWPPPSAGMLCFAEYHPANASYSVLFDVQRGLVGGEYPVVYYDYRGRPPTVRRIAESFLDWVSEHCIDDIDGHG